MSMVSTGRVCGIAHVEECADAGHETLQMICPWGGELPKGANVEIALVAYKGN